MKGILVGLMVLIALIAGCNSEKKEPLPETTYDIQVVWKTDSRNPKIVYYGDAFSGIKEDEADWHIVRIDTTDTSGGSVKSAKGVKDRILKFSDRETYEY